MSIQIKCPNPACGKQYSLKDDQAGKTVRCEACGKPFQVPVPAKKWVTLPTVCFHISGPVAR